MLQSTSIWHMADACRVIVLAALMFFLLYITGCGSTASSSKILGQQAPRYTKFVMLDGTTTVIDQFSGKHLVVLFWANSCNQSHRVINDLNEFLAKHGKRLNVDGVAVSIDKPEDEPRLRDRITYGKLDNIRHSFSGNEIYDEAKIAFDVGSLPSVFLVDTQGKVVDGGSSMGFVYSYFGVD